MALYTKESLDRLRERVDLPELISSYIQLKRAGATFKALCPFHEEKTPSFVVQSGDTHYHCFGCNAHGDAIAFLMNHLKLNFVEAVEMLADRFGLALEKETGPVQSSGPSKADLKAILEEACQIYQYLLLHSEEGRAALQYLAQRSIDLEFIKRFRIGYAPSEPNLLSKLLYKKGFTTELLRAAGLIASTSTRDFFSERITFPITDAFGAVIGFSARKLKESTFGGKYINTPETLLFKKSHVLFGLSYSRQRLAKERKALLVEGQIDALRLIYEGFDWTVATQGTAFGEGQIKELTQLGVTEVFIAFDPDEAGQTAAAKTGHLLQKKGLGARVVPLPLGADPDLFLREKGPEAFKKLIQESAEYIAFLIRHLAKSHDLNNPAQKTNLVQKIASQIREWEDPVMVHESLRKLAQLTSIPEHLLGVKTSSSPIIQRFGRTSKVSIDLDRILETDLLRWLILRGSEEPILFTLARNNISEEMLRHPFCRKIYAFLLDSQVKGETIDLMALGSLLETAEEQTLLSEIIGRKVNLQKAQDGLVEVMQRLLQRQWMEKREALRLQIQNASQEDQERLIKAFDLIGKNPPLIIKDIG